MKMAFIILAILGTGLVIWGLLGFAVVWNPPEDPPLPSGVLDQFRWAATREVFLGGSLIVLAWFLRRKHRTALTEAGNG